MCFKKENILTELGKKKKEKRTDLRRKRIISDVRGEGWSVDYTKIESDKYEVLPKWDWTGPNYAPVKKHDLLPRNQLQDTLLLRTREN